MQGKKGYTLVELMIVIAIIGILAGLALPSYRTYQQRAYATHAQLTLKEIMNAQLVYYLEHNKFYPEDNTPIVIMSTEPENSAELKKIRDGLHLAIPTGRTLDYYFYAANNDPANTSSFTLVVRSSFDFPLFINGSSVLTGILDTNGTTDIFTLAH
ncbi:MAG: prepilin-type N-terminal cleavage/methylation domain-containing protein [Desulfobacteraceae bacterium]|nr:MAG: prepilin-type N-terminal cleavage/methylation domain-containing protein [Desulfobacteraceae bacterium]